MARKSHGYQVLAYTQSGERLLRAARYQEAINELLRALRMAPFNEQVHFGLARALFAVHRYPSALQHCDAILQCRPSHAPAMCIKGSCLQRTGKLAEAIATLSMAVQYAPREPEAHYRLAEACLAADDAESAVKHYERLLELRPQFWQAYLNYGCALKMKGDLETALPWFAEAARRTETAPEALRNLAVTCHELREFQAALQFYQQALQLRPHWPEALVGRSVTLLACEEFSAGWQDYDHRHLAADGFSDADLPLWNGDRPVPSSLLVFGEQGVGTEIMFASCLPQLLDEAIDCRVQCDDRLVPLFRRSFPRAEFFGNSQAEAPRDRSARVGLGSLPRLYRRQPSDFPGKGDFLTVDPVEANEWHDRLEQLGPGMKIGISWRGGKPKQRKARCPQLSHWLPLLQAANACWINLQYGACAEDQQWLADHAGTTIHDWDDLDQTNHLDRLAALLSQLDLVISVANSTVHLAGAVGAPTWTLLPFAADYRWHGNGETNLWHPTVRLFRQPFRHDWETPMRALANALANALADVLAPSLVPAGGILRAAA